jgi:hypothetical protein
MREEKGKRDEGLSLKNEKRPFLNRSNYETNNAE